MNSNFCRSLSNNWVSIGGSLDDSRYQILYLNDILSGAQQVRIAGMAIFIYLTGIKYLQPAFALC